MKFNRCMDTNIYPEAIDTQTTIGTMPQNMMGSCCNQVIMCSPIVECPSVRCCHRVINYEVPHIIPCHTTMVNHHIYHHTYQPSYSYSEEDETSEVYDPKCCQY
jgi:hypothetical protein